MQPKAPYRSSGKEPTPAIPASFGTKPPCTCVRSGSCALFLLLLGHFAPFALRWPPSACSAASAPRRYGAYGDLWSRAHGGRSADPSDKRPDDQTGKTTGSLTFAVQHHATRYTLSSSPLYTFSYSLTRRYLDTSSVAAPSIELRNPTSLFSRSLAADNHSLFLATQLIHL